MGRTDALFSVRGQTMPVAHDLIFAGLLSSAPDGLERQRAGPHHPLHHGQRPAGFDCTRDAYGAGSTRRAGGAYRAHPLGTLVVTDRFLRRGTSGGTISPWPRPTTFSML